MQECAHTHGADWRVPRTFQHVLMLALGGSRVQVWGQMEE